MGIHVLFPETVVNSPLGDNKLRCEHETQFQSSELISLKRIGTLSAKRIRNDVNGNILNVEDVGEFAGAGHIDVTDDIIVCIDNGKSIGYSLKATKQSIGQILSKNMGANSLIEQYFYSPVSQNFFTEFFKIKRLEFLNRILNTNFNYIKDAIEKIRNDSSKKGYKKPRFKYYPNANSPRDMFLHDIRDKLYEILIEKIEVENIIQACNLILDSGKKQILASYRENEEKTKLIINRIQNIDDYKEIRIRGNDSVEVVFNDYKIGFRFKFESDITSNIKLVGDYT
jgi:hypothetical protein